MTGSRGQVHGGQLLADEKLLELLHHEADGELMPTEAELLATHQENPEVQAARIALRRAVMFLSGPNPPMPHSVAGVVAQEVALSAALSAAASPVLPVASVARQVAAEVTLSRHLKTCAPLPPASVAGAVVQEIQTAKLLGPDLRQVPPMPRSVAASVTAEIALAQQLSMPPLPRSVAAAVSAELRVAQSLAKGAIPRPERSVAAGLAFRIAQETQQPNTERPNPEQPNTENRPAPIYVVPTHAAPIYAAPTNTVAATVPATVPPRAMPQHPALSPGLALQSLPAATPPRNLAPVLLVGSLLLGVTLLAVTTAWPNLAAGAVVLQTLLAQVSPLAGMGLALLLLTSILMTWKPNPTWRPMGAAAYALAGALTLPALYNVVGGTGGLNIGQNVTVSGPVSGNVIAIGGNVHLKPEARVAGEVVTLLGDVQRDSGATVQGHVAALLGHAPGDLQATETQPVSAMSLATAAAFRPVLGWLGGAAWPQIFVALTGGVLLLLFVAGAAPALARRQRHAPMRTLSLGVLILAALLLPAVGLALTGFLGAALLAGAVAALLVATGLSVSVYDAGRALAYHLRLPVPDAVGALMGLSAFAASLSYGPLAFVLALVGGVWGAGTLFLSRQQLGRAGR